MQPLGARALLTAKLATPPPRTDAVVRPRLHARLRAGADTALTVVVAAAGWGKTTLLTSWAADPAEPRPVGWLSLDEGDDEPVRFWTYALSALATVAPEVAGEPLAALAGQGLDPVAVALPVLLNALAGVSERYVLVLDDYHVLTDPRIHDTVGYLLGYLPPALHLVIAARADPPLPLARMRARGALREVRAADLRCTPDEGAALLAGSGAAVTDAAGLVACTEGWPAGLRLAALALRDSGHLPATVHGDQRHFLGYFTDEVMPDLDDTARDLLVRCSVLERLSGPLCDAVLGCTGSAAVLDRLERADLFVTALDPQRHWYRCHRLFRDVLRRELDTAGPHQVALLLGRAADWHLAAGWVEDAVRLRIAAGDRDGARALLDGHWFLDNGAFAALLQLGEQLAAHDPVEPRLAVWLALAAALSGCPQETTRRWLHRAEPLITADAEPPAGWSSLRAFTDVVWAGYTALDSPERALEHAARAVGLETDPTCWGRVYARMVLAAAQVDLGHVQDAVALLHDAWHTPARAALPTLLALQTAGELMCHLVTLDRHAEARRIAADVADTAAAVQRAWGPGHAAAVFNIRLAEARMVHAEDGPVAALPALRSLVAMAEQKGGRNGIVYALTGYADALWGAGDRPAARAALARARQHADANPPCPDAAARLATLETRIARHAATHARADRHLHENLTDRELTLLRALQGSLSAREIGAQLHLSLNTVKTYSKSLYRKLGVTTRADAVARGRHLGLI